MSKYVGINVSVCARGRDVEGPKVHLERFHRQGEGGGGSGHLELLSWIHLSELDGPGPTSSTRELCELRQISDRLPGARGRVLGPVSVKPDPCPD